jgi:hypothetical protein
MASGHVNRIYRPNTWQHRPSLQREESPCQPGAVHTWHLADMPERLTMSAIGGEADLALSSADVAFDPEQTSHGGESILGHM